MKKNKHSIIDDFPEIPLVPQTPVPEWVLKDDEESVRAMFQDIYAAVFWAEVDKLKIDGGAKPKNISSFDWYQAVLETNPETIQMINAKLITEGLTKSMVASDELKDRSERAFMFYLYQLKTNNRFMIAGEYSNLEEFLIDKLPHLQDKPGERSNILFMLEEMLPLLKQIDDQSKTETLVNATLIMRENYSKSRAAIPEMNKAVQRVNGAIKAHEETISDKQKAIQKLSKKVNKTKSEEEKQKLEEQIRSIKTDIDVIESDKALIMEVAMEKFTEDIGEILTVIADPSIPVNGVNGVASRLKRGNKKINIRGTMSMLPKATIFVFSVPAEYTTTTQNELDFIDFMNIDPVKLPPELEKMLKKYGGKK